MLYVSDWNRNGAARKTNVLIGSNEEKATAKYTEQYSADEIRDANDQLNKHTAKSHIEMLPDAQAATRHSDENLRWQLNNIQQTQIVILLVIGFCCHWKYSQLNGMNEISF